MGPVACTAWTVMLCHSGHLALNMYTKETIRIVFSTHKCSMAFVRLMLALH